MRHLVGLRSWILSIFFGVAVFALPLYIQAQETSTAKDDPDTPDRIEESADESENTPQQSIVASKDSKYSRPLRFSPEDNGVSLMSPQIKWDMKTGTEINLGGLVLRSSRMAVRLSELKRDGAPRSFRRTDSDSFALAVLSIRWPEYLLQTGKLEFVGQDGKVLWEREIDNADRSNWNYLLKTKASSLKSHRGSQFGILDIGPEELPFVKDGTVFRACISQTLTDSEKIRTCSTLYRIQTQKGRFRLSRVADQQVANVSVDGINVGPTGIVTFNPGKVLHVKIQFADGVYYEFDSGPIGLDLIDVVQSEDENQVVILGQGPKPIGKVRNVIVPANHFWSETGIKREVVWQTIVPTSEPIIRVLGSFNIPFGYFLRFEKLPKESERAYISDETGTGTYARRTKIYGYVGSQNKVSSKEFAAKTVNANEFIWMYDAPKIGQLNRSRVSITRVDKPDRKFVANYEFHRAHSSEFNLRLTGVLTSGFEALLFGEVAGSHWFQDLGFSDDPKLAKTRWGVSGKYFRTLTTAGLTGDLPLDTLQVAVGDIKYNIVEGLWNRDEIFGVAGSVQSVLLTGGNANLLGLGFYWARTMPKIFDKIFNIASFMRYPKYVDLELIYYAFSADAATVPLYSYSMNFHGKVFWKERLYGEAGFGIRQYAYQNTSTGNEILFGMAFGTIGLGYLF